MQINEVIASPTKVAITSEFDKAYKIFSTANPTVVPTVTLRFCISKLRGEPVGGNDKPLTAILSGFNRYHVISGKCIILYKRVGDTLRLYNMVTHKEYEGNNARNMANWMKSLSDNSFIEINPEKYFAPETHDRETMNGEDFKKINQIIYDLVAEQAFFVLKPALDHSDWKNFFDWLSANDITVTPVMVFDAFGDEQQLKNFIFQQIHQFGLDQAYNQHS